MSLLRLTLLVTLAAGAGSGRAGDQPKTALKTESFDEDPGWEGLIGGKRLGKSNITRYDVFLMGNH